MSLCTFARMLPSQATCLCGQPPYALDVKHQAWQGGAHTHTHTHTHTHKRSHHLFDWCNERERERESERENWEPPPVCLVRCSLSRLVISACRDSISRCRLRSWFSRSPCTRCNSKFSCMCQHHVSLPIRMRNGTFRIHVLPHTRTPLLLHTVILHFCFRGLHQARTRSV